MSRVIKAGESARGLLPFDAEELHGRSGAGPELGESSKVRLSLAREITSRSHLERLIKEEMAELVARLESAASERLEEVEARRQRLEKEIAGARREAWDKGRKEGYEAGYEAGYDEGVRAGLDSFQGLLRTAQGLLDRLKAMQEGLVEQSRDDLLRLAVAIAHKLVPVALEQADAARALAEEMLRKAEGSATARVRVAPATLEALGGDGAPRLGVPEGVHVEFVPDGALGAGDVVVETDWGIIDGRLRARWRRILQGLDILEDGDVDAGAE